MKFSQSDETPSNFLTLKPAEAIRVIEASIDEARTVGSTFSCIWHNQHLCDKEGWKGWREVYERMIEYGIG